MPMPGVSQQQPVVAPPSVPVTIPITPVQNTGSVFTPPPAQSAFSNPSPVDNTSTGAAVVGNGAMMQPSNAYNFSGIPASSRPVNYIAPQSRQEEVE